MQTFAWTPFLIFAAANAFTPGPNIILLAGSGSRFGFKKTLPHLLGVSCGFPLMVLVVVAGSGEVFRKFPWVFTVLTVVSLAYITWLAYRILKMGFHDDLKISARSRPMTFIEGCLFQWINAKAWQMALMIATLYVVPTFNDRLIQASSLGLITFAAGTVWIDFAKRITKYLKKAWIKKSYYIVLSLALILTTWPRGLGVLTQAIRQ